MDATGIEVLMPYYNGGRFVREQIRSVLDQSVQPVRLTVLDNGSDIEDSKILRDIGSQSNRVRIFRIEQNCGVVGAIERLLQSVEYPYFALADADDLWDRDKLEISLQLIQGRQLDLVYTDLRMADEQGSEFHPSKWQFSNTPPLGGSCAIQLVLKNPVAGCTILATKRLLQHALPFPKGIPMHDRWLAIVAALGNGIGFVDRATVSYRQHAANDTGGLGFGRRALRERIRRTGGTFQSYSRRRREAHRTLLRYIAANSRSPIERKTANLMARYMETGRLGTLLTSVPYAALVSVVGRRVGIRNIAADIALSTAAGMLASEVMESAAA
jgi:glycosyltransferase involved in cell wall biosynthesis